jgi:hypothetical protein
MGRPSKLTPRVRQAIVQAVSAGSTFRAAAEHAGVSERTLRSWLARGRAERDAPRIASGEAPYVLLVRAAERAGAGVELRASSLIMAAAETDWRAAAWFSPAATPRTGGPRSQSPTSKSSPTCFQSCSRTPPTRSSSCCKTSPCDAVAAMTPERKLWDARVKRDRSRHSREHADAVHDFLRKVAPNRWPAVALEAPIEESRGRPSRLRGPAGGDQRRRALPGVMSVGPEGRASGSR